jgi:hypothetical protein
MAEPVGIGPTRTQQRKEIIAAIIYEYGIDERLLTGKAKSHALVNARIDAAQRLRAIGLYHANIGVILNRDRTVIGKYLNKTARKNISDRMRLKRLHRMLPKDVHAVVNEFAEKQETTPVMILSEWIIERATHEMESRAREARSAA